MTGCFEGCVPVIAQILESMYYCAPRYLGDARLGVAVTCASPSGAFLS